MLMMLPPPACRMAGTTALQQFQIPLTFTAIAASHSASLIASNRPPLRPPKSAALLMSASMRPKASSAMRAVSAAEVVEGVVARLTTEMRAESHHDRLGDDGASCEVEVGPHAVGVNLESRQHELGLRQRAGGQEKDFRQ